ncbi:peptidylprolyl isomerase [bacterium]|nr:peptidylprolyl isomerase [bacterium]
MKDKDYFAVLNTTKGQIIIHLFTDKTPIAVRNFVNLAEGSKPWRDPNTGKAVRERFYDGLTFHRVIPGFLIQGGDPLGTGSGGPGYAIEDEIDPDLTFDKDFMVAMYNEGPGTSGSQFFITDKQSTPTHLNGRNTIFGRVVEGFDVVSAIAKVSRNEMDRPIEPVVIEFVQIIRIPAGQDFAGRPWQYVVEDTPPPGKKRRVFGATEKEKPVKKFEGRQLDERQTREATRPVPSLQRKIKPFKAPGSGS